MMMPEQVQAGLHGREYFVDLGFAGVRPASAGKRPERPRRFVAQEDVHAAEPRTRADLLADEVSAFVCELGRLHRVLLRVRQLRGARLVPRRRERASQAGDDEGLTAVAVAEDLDRRPIRNMMQIRREIARGYGVEVVVVAVNPVDGRAGGFIAAICGRQVPYAQPERDLAVPLDDRSRGRECAVDVA